MSVAVDGGGAYSEASWWLALELSCAAGALLGLAIASLTRRLLAWRRCSCVQLPQPRERTDTALGRLLDYSRAGAALLASLALCIRCVDAPGRDFYGRKTEAIWFHIPKRPRSFIIFLLLLQDILMARLPEEMINQRTKPRKLL